MPTPSKTKSREIVCPNCKHDDDLIWVGYHDAWTSVYGPLAGENDVVFFEWSGSMEYADEHTGLAHIRCRSCQAVLAEERMIRADSGEAVSRRMCLVDGSSRDVRTRVFAQLAGNPSDPSIFNQAVEQIRRSGFDDLESTQIALGFALAGSTVYSLAPGDPRRGVLDELALALTSFR